MTYDFDALLDRVEKPARYTGGEMNAEVKPISQAEISFAFCFPDTYEVAMSHLGMIIYGIGIGVITVVIRVFGAYPEGVSFAILIMNAFTPLINAYVKPKRFGEKKKTK